MRHRHPLFAALIALLLGLAGQAQAATAPTPPDQLAQRTALELRTEMGKREAEFRRDRNALYRFAADHIEPYFDFPYIARLVLGRHWRDANAEQRQRFTVAFKNMLIRTYSNAVLEHYKAKLEWQPATLPAGATDALIHSRVLREDGRPPVPINYRLHLVDGGWKVYDVTVEEISLITNYRGSFATEIRKSGLDSLIAKLEQKQAAGS